MTFDALIIGGGPAGATTALLLAEAGWSVAIVEKKRFPRRKVCGEFISATSLPLLKKLGLSDFYLTHSGPEIRRVGLFAADTLLDSPMPSADHSLGHWGRALGREHLDSVLLEKARDAGATVWQPWQVKSLQRNLDIFTCMMTSQDETKEISARLVIMANGSWEKGFEPAQNDLHKPSDLLAFKAHFKNGNLDADLMPLLSFPGGYGGLVNSDHDRVTLSCCIRRDSLQKIRIRYSGLQAGEAVLQHISDTSLGVRQVFKHAKREGNWLSAGPIKPGIRQKYTNGIFYVGNIAGEAHPVVAEGISMAMQSGWLLSQILLSNKNTKEAGRKYTKEWDKCFSNRIHFANIIAQISMHPQCILFILPILKQFPSLLTLCAKWSGKVKQVVTRSVF